MDRTGSSTPMDTPTPRPPGRARRLTRRLVALALPALALPVLGPLTLLVFLAGTRPGRLVGWLAVASFGAIACSVALLWPAPRARAWAVALAACLVAAAGLGIALSRYRAPHGQGGETGLRSVVLGPAGLMRPGPLGVLPESDLMNLVANVLSRLIPGIDPEHARRIRRVVARLGREVEDDPAGRSLPPVTHLALAELLGRPFDAGHYYAYVPEHAPGEALGAIVFLHGNAGNSRVLPWAWRTFADRHRFAIVVPTYGFGFWGEGGVEAVDRALDDATRRLPIDPARVYLAGLSDGGNGVTRSGRARPDRYRGLIYISPTMRPDELGSPEFLRGWQGRPVLVLQGDRDANVRKADVDPAVDLLWASGVDVSYRVFPGEDHFLFFGRPDAVFASIAAWMMHPANTARRAPGAAVE